MSKALYPIVSSLSVSKRPQTPIHTVIRWHDITYPHDISSPLTTGLGHFVVKQLAPPNILFQDKGSPGTSLPRTCRPPFPCPYALTKNWKGVGDVSCAFRTPFPYRCLFTEKGYEMSREFRTPFPYRCFLLKRGSRCLGGRLVWEALVRGYEMSGGTNYMGITCQGTKCLVWQDVRGGIHSYMYGG